MTETDTDSRTKPTPAQMDVLELIAQGYTDDEISEKLGISPLTARTHSARLLRRMDVRTRAAAVYVACQEGWL